VYLDSLQALALVGLVLQQAGGWQGLALVVPSLPILLATAGAAVARDLKGAPLNPWPELGRRVRHLLVPLCVLALVAIAVNLSRGEAPTASGEEGSPPAGVLSLLPWLVPVGHLGGSAVAPGWAPAQWYVSTSLWLLLLSPALGWLFRRWPLRTLAVPLLGVLAAAVSIWVPSGSGGSLLLSLMVFAPCWLLGFALADNRIRTVSPSRVGAVALALMVLGVCVAATYPGSGGDIVAVPQALALWGSGVLLILLRLRPARAVLVLRPWVGTVVTVMSTRALTVLLWTGPAIWLAGSVTDLVPFLRSWSTVTGVGHAQQVAVSVLLVAAAVQVFGWIEDLATRQGASVDARSLLQTGRRSAVTLRSHVHRPPRAASVGGAVVGIVGLAVAMLPPAAADAEPTAPPVAERAVDRDDPRSPVHDRFWDLGLRGTDGVTGVAGTSAGGGRGR
jgi:hypothetical protein